MNRFSKTGKGRAPSFGSILFWTLFLVAQGYLLWVYHTLRWTDLDSSQTSLATATQRDFRHEFEARQTRPKPNANSPNTKPNSNTKPNPPTTKHSRSIDQADGTFNGYPIYKLRNKSLGESKVKELYSQFHCVGETWHDAEFHKRSKTYHEQSWMFRSCQFQVLCYDTLTQEYAMYLDPQKHQDSHQDHQYHHEDSSNPHPSPHIQKILDKQNQQLSKEQTQVDDPNHKRTTTTDFKHPTFLDDTSTIYRNHTVVVNSKGEIVLGDTEQGKHYGVSIGSINGKWGLVDIQRLKWFPQVRWGPVHKDESYEVYTLPESVVMIPFHSLSAENPGHLVWDDFLPMYTLLDMFGLLPKRNAEGRSKYSGTNHPQDTSDWMDILPIRYTLPNMERGLWASCDWTNDKKASCNHMLSKFGTLLGTRRSYLKFHGNKENNNNTQSKVISNPNGILNPITASKMPTIAITTNKNVQLQLHQDAKDSKPKLICAKNAFAGFGAIADHLPNHGHGWQKWDYWYSYNSGRGNHLWEFRNYMIHNLFYALPQQPAPIAPLPEDTRRRLDYNVNRIGRLTTKPSVLLGKEQISSYPPRSITDSGPDEPLIVLFSAYSSQRRGGSMEAEAQLLWEIIQESGGAYQFLYGKPPSDGAPKLEIIIENHTFSKYTIEEQIQMASRASVFVTYCGGGAITGSFLPKGAALHLYYGEDQGIEHNRNTGLPARLDWDFFNHCGYLHIKWLPFYASMSKWPKNYIDGGEFESQALANVEIMRQDLRRIHSERVKHYKKQA